jgi:hypothetical protein
MQPGCKGTAANVRTPMLYERPPFFKLIERMKYRLVNLDISNFYPVCMKFLGLIQSTSEMGAGISGMVSDDRLLYPYPCASVSQHRVGDALGVVCAP